MTETLILFLTTCSILRVVFFPHTHHDHALGCGKKEDGRRKQGRRGGWRERGREGVREAATVIWNSTEDPEIELKMIV